MTIRLKQNQGSRDPTESLCPSFGRVTFFLKAINVFMKSEKTTKMGNSIQGYLFMGIRLPTENIQFPNLALDIQYSKMDFRSHGNRLKTAFEVDPPQCLATAISLLVNNEFPAEKNRSH